MRYRKKQLEVEAWQWDGTVKSIASETVPDWIDQAMKDHKVYFRISKVDPKHPHMHINTEKSQIPVEKNDYIILDSDVLYPCKPDVFEETYEEVLDGEGV